MKTIVGGTKDENGIFIPKRPVPPTPTSIEPETPSSLSIDKLLEVGLRNIHRMMQTISKQAVDGFDRETVQNLKDLMAMLKDLKKEEKDILAELSDEDLKKLSEK